MRILLAIDGSKDAETATAFLKQLPLPPSTALRIMVVVTLPTFPLDVPPVREFKRSALEDVQRVIDDARASLAPRGFGIETDVAVGDAKEEIVRAAEEWEADLVVLGARGLGRIKRFLLGSVSLAVARHARCPVLVVKGRPRKLGSVLVAMDGSEDSFQAVRFLLSLPLPRPTKVSAVFTEPQAESGNKVLERAATQLDDKVTRVTRSTATGNPADEIVATAAAHDTDLVLVGARGHGGMARLLLGSVSEKVLRDARGPVLIVKGRST